MGNACKGDKESHHNEGDLYEVNPDRNRVHHIHRYGEHVPQTALHENKGFYGQNRFNRWGMDRDDYYNRVSYGSGWNPSIHDRMLEEKVEQVFHKYKTNKSGELKPKHFHKAY